MKFLSIIGRIQFFIFGAVSWFIGFKILISLFDSLGIFLAFTPLVFLGPIYYAIVEGFDNTVLIWLAVTVLSSVGFYLMYFADNHDDRTSES